MRAIVCSLILILLAAGGAMGATLDPDAVEPGQAFTIADVDPLPSAEHILAVAADGTTIELSFVVSESGRLVVFAPAHPDGLENGGSLELRFPGGESLELGSLTVLPMSPPRPDPGAELARLARAQARSLGWEPDELARQFDRKPGSLSPDAFLSAALLEVIDGGEGSIRWLLDETEGTEAGRRLREVFGSEALLSELERFLAGSTDTSLAMLPPAAVLLQFGVYARFPNDARRQHLRNSHPAMWEDAEDGLEITTAAELDYWMEKRAAIDRHLAPPQLPDWKSDPKGRLTSELDRRAAAELESRINKLADAVAKNSPGVRALLLAKNAAGSLFDLFMAPINFDLQKEQAQLPSKLEPLQCSAPDSPHFEDDPRGGPAPMEVARWTATVVASNEPWKFTVDDALKLMKSLEGMLTSMASDLEAIATFGASSEEKDEFTRLVGEVNKMRKKVQDQHAKAMKNSGEGGDVFCPAGVGCLEESATAWGPIDVSAAEWVAGSVHSGSCVRIGTMTGSSADGGIFTGVQLDGSGSWSPPGGEPVGYTIADTGTCTLRLMTRSDRFGGVKSEGSTDVQVDPILVHVSADPMTPREGQEVKLDATVENAYDETVSWPHNGSDQNSTTWTAPELEPTECSREFRLEAESMSRQGIRHSGTPPRTGAATVRVIDPENQLQVTPPVANTRTNQPVQFRADFSGASATPAVTWQSTGGSISSDGSFVSSQPGTFEVMAMLPDGSVDCSGSAVVHVCEQREGPNRNQVTASGQVSYSFNDGFTHIYGQPASRVGPRDAPPGTCMISFGFAPDRSRPQFEAGLSAAVEGGLKMGSYKIVPSGTIVTDKKKIASRGSFFGYATTGPDLNGDGMTSHFKCESGQFDVGFFDGRYIEGSFQFKCEENVPTWKRKPRKITVQGDFAHTFASSGPMAYGCEPPPCGDE
jgi:hypothetical protein